MHAQVNTVLAILSELLFLNEEFIKNPSRFTRIVAHGHNVSPAAHGDYCNFCVSFQSGECAAIPSPASEWFY